MTGFFMTGLTVKKQPTLHGWWQVNQITTYPSSMMTGRRSTRRPSLYYVYYNLLQEFKSPTTSRVKNCKNWVNPSYLMKVVCHLVIVHDKRVPTRHQIWRVASSCHERWRVVTTFHNPFLVHGITGSRGFRLTNTQTEELTRNRGKPKYVARRLGFCVPVSA